MATSTKPRHRTSTSFGTGPAVDIMRRSGMLQVGGTGRKAAAAQDGTMERLLQKELELELLRQQVQTAEYYTAQIEVMEAEVDHKNGVIIEQVDAWDNVWYKNGMLRPFFVWCSCTAYLVIPQP
jgi:hypothetical protein